MGREKQMQLRGPWGGLAQLASGKHIPPTELTDCENVQQRGGRISPRPGYEKVLDEPLITATTVISGAPSSHIAIDVSGSKIYWVDTSGGKIRRANTDGTGAEDVVTGLTFAYGIALNVGAGHVYFTETTTGKVRRTTMTPAGAITDIVTTASTPRGITVDASNSHLYWCDDGSNTIKRSTLAGASITTIVSSLSTPNDIQIDLTNSPNKLYFSDSQVGIRRCNLDGSSLETIASFIGAAGIDISFYGDVDHVTWADNGTTDAISHAMLDGSGATDFISSGFAVGGPVGLCVDSSNGVVYWTEGGTTIKKASLNQGIISSFFWKRSLLGSGSTSFTDDLMLLQSLRVGTGGSDFRVYFPSRSSANDVFEMTPGHTAGSANNPARWVQISRTADPSASDPVIPVGNYGRASFAATGYGFDTLKGGIRMAAGSGGYVFNYHVGDADADEVQTLTVTGGATGGTFKLSFGGQETSGLAYNISNTDLETALEGLSSIGSNNVTVDASYNITFAGDLESIGLPLLKVSNNSLTGGNAPDVIIERTTKGQSYPHGLMILIPSGLPTPPTPTITKIAHTTSNLTGTFEWVITWYSTLLGWESPPSEMVSEIEFNADSADVFWTVPSTNYFDNYFSSPSVPFGEVIDKVRVYRKQTGNNTSGAANGVGAQSDYFFVGEGAANKGYFRDNVATSAQTSDVAPVWKANPPVNANFVIIVDDVAYWAAGGNNKTVWNSEKSQIGAAGDIVEYGYDYVDPNSFTIMSDDAPQDSGITGMGRLGKILVVFTDERAYAADASQVDEIGLAFRRIEGAAGCASHWCICETNPLAGDEIQGGLLLYAHPKGGMYAFNGATAEPIARDDIATIISTLSSKTWQDIETGVGSITSWYYATAVLDPDKNRILLAAPLQDGGSVVLVYDLDTRKWLKWNINKLAWCVGREWESGSSQGRPVVLMTDGSSIFKLQDGKGDDGEDFDWFAQFANWDMGLPMKTKQLYALSATFDIIDYGSSPTITASAYLDDRTSATVSRSGSISSTNHFPLTVKSRARHCALRIAGTQSDDMDHPALVGVGAEFEPVGLRLE